MAKDTSEEEYMATYTRKELYDATRDYWRQVKESEGFDIEDIAIPSSKFGMIPGLRYFDCQKPGYIPFRLLINLYAKVGLHRYNMLEGTSFQLGALIKVNMTLTCLCSYYITLVAHDAASTTDKTFQVRIDEAKPNNLYLNCSVARLKGEVTTTEKPFIPHFHGGATTDPFFDGELPDWPSDDALNDAKRVYVLKKSEWQAIDWVSMYLELLICAQQRQEPPEMKQLEILKVAIETNIEQVEPLDERLKAKSAIVYITFKGIVELRAVRQDFEIGEHVERKAIVRRVIDEHTGSLTLEGQYCGGIRRPPFSALSKAGKKKRPRLG